MNWKTDRSYENQGVSAMSVLIGRVNEARKLARKRLTREERIADELSGGVVSEDKAWQLMAATPEGETW